MPGWWERLTGLGSRARLDPGDYPEGPVRELAAAMPATATPWNEAELVVLDLETSGLDPERDAVLSAGWVPVLGGEVHLAGARRVVVRPPDGTDLSSTVTVHGLTDDELARAPTLAEAVPELLSALTGRVLVAHHARVEVGFLGRATRAVLGCSVPLLVLDTLRLQHRLVVGDHGEVVEGSLRLDASRSHFGLPRYRAHEALTDALATAELLLAQAATLGRGRERAPTLADLGARLHR